MRIFHVVTEPDGTIVGYGYMPEEEGAIELTEEQSDELQRLANEGTPGLRKLQKNGKIVAVTADPPTRPNPSDDRHTRVAAKVTAVKERLSRGQAFTPAQQTALAGFIDDIAELLTAD